MGRVRRKSVPELRRSSGTLERPWRELADESDLGLELITELLADCALSDEDQLANVLRRRATKIDENVRVHVRDLGVPVPESLEPNLIDEAAGTNSLDLLEDRSGARVPFEPRVPCPAPGEILLHDLLHRAFVATRETKGDGESDIASVVEDRVVIAELDVIRPDCLALTLLAQDLT